MQDAAAVADPECELQSKDNMLFASTAISNGSGLAVVNSIGMQTEIGAIQSQIQEAAKEEDDTPLKKKLDEFGEALAKVRPLARTSCQESALRGVLLDAKSVRYGCTLWALFVGPHVHVRKSYRSPMW